MSDTPKTPPRALGVIGTVLVAIGVSWWWNKDDKKEDDPPKPKSGFVVTDSTATPERGGLFDGQIDAARDRAIAKAGTNWPEIQSWVKKVRYFFDGLKADGTPKSSPVPTPAVEPEPPAPEARPTTKTPPVVFRDETYAPGYGQAYAKAKAMNKPLLVLIGASWCPHCKTTKAALQELYDAGELDGLEYGYLDFDEDSENSREMLVGDKVPQVILYRTFCGGGVKRNVGGMTKTQLRAFVKG